MIEKHSQKEKDNEPFMNSSSSDYSDNNPYSLPISTSLTDIPAPKDKYSKRYWYLRAFAITLFIALLFYLVFGLFREYLYGQLVILIEWMEGIGDWAFLAIIGLIILSGIPFVQGYSALLVSAGFIFNSRIFLGWLAAYCGAFFGVILGVYLGHIFEERVSKKVEKFPMLVDVKDQLTDQSLRLIVLLRLSPLSYSVLNGFLAITGIPPLRVIAASAAGILPETAILVSIGSTVHSAADAISGSDSLEPGTPKFYLFLVQIVVLVVVVLLISFYVKKAWNDVKETISRRTSEDSHVDSVESNSNIPQFQEIQAVSIPGFDPVY